MFTLDTNILIYYADGDEKTSAFLEKHENEIFYLPTIVVAEFLSYPLLDKSIILKFEDFVSQTILVNLNFPISKAAAEIRREYKLRLADAVIAASAITTDSYLVTRNIRDFKKISQLKLISL